MHGVGPGSLVGGRYLVKRRVAQHSRYERWSAADQTLDREVVLLCFDADGPIASSVLDAARRAAGVEDHRLVRVLDVGRDEGLAYVVEEPLTGARSVTSILSNGGLPADEGRRVVGEAASALERARARGLHHGVLTPRSVLRLEDGSIKVRGLATEAALVEADDGSSEQASRADTVALVGLAYAALTGRWPLTGPDAGLEPAPRVAGGVAAPSEIAAGVPPDLDLVARRTLNEDRGPATPGELAEEIAPWPPVPVGGATPGRRTLDNRTEPLTRDPSTGGVSRTSTGPAEQPHQPDEHEQPDGGTGDDANPREGAGLGSTGPGRPAVVAGAVAAGAAAGTAAVAKGLGTALDAAGGLATTVSGRVGGLARGAAERAAERSTSRAQRRETEQFEDPLFFGEDVRLSDTLEATDERLGPALPLLPGAAQEPLDRDQSRWALIIVAAFVLVAAILGIWGLPKLSGIGGSASPVPIVTRTATVKPSAPSAVAPPSAPSPAPPPANQPIGIVRASQLDLENGGVQASRTAPLAYDGNPDTMWRSSKWYATANFGGVKKQGLGLVLDLGQPTDVHQVAFTLRGASDVTVYVASRPAIAGATAIGSVSGKDGDASVSVAGGGGVKGNLVIIWFTSLGPDGEGHFRAQIAEAKVT